MVQKGVNKRNISIRSSLVVYSLSSGTWNSGKNETDEIRAHAHPHTDTLNGNLVQPTDLLAFFPEGN